MLLLSAYLLLHLSSVQTWLVQKACKSLSEDLNTSVTIGKVDLSFFDKLKCEEICILDQNKDTVLKVGIAEIELNDWFFLKNKLTLESVKAKDVLLRLKRTDEKWNYTFLEDYFSKPSSPPKKSKSNFKFELQKINLESFRFDMIDGWRGEDMIFSFDHFISEIKRFDTDNKWIDFLQTDLNNPSFSRKDYTGLRKKNGFKTKPKIQTNENKLSDANEWRITSTLLNIKKGTFQNDLETERPAFTDQFDGFHFRFNDINASMRNLSLLKDTLTATLSLATKEQCGFEVKKLEAEYKFTPQKMEFRNLTLETPQSHLSNYFSMNFDSFNDDMSEFVDSVVMKGHFVSSLIHSDDIAFFAPELKSLNKSFKLSADANGTVESLQVNDLSLKSMYSEINGELHLWKMTNVDSLSFQLTSNQSRCDLQDLNSFFPAIKKTKQPDLMRLQHITFTGNTKGNIRDISIDGTLNNALGKIETKTNLKFPKIGPPVYKGILSAQKFKLGSFLNEPMMGSVSLVGKIDGSGFSAKEFLTRFEGYISELEFNNYGYTNINIIGQFDKSKFTGHLDVNDPNLKLEYLDGSMTFLRDSIKLKMKAELKQGDFKKLYWTNKEFMASGKLDLDFSGNDIDHFLGKAGIYDGAFISNGKKMGFDSMILTSKFENNLKQLALHSNQIDADLTGDFKLLELPSAFRFFLSRYFPKYINQNTGKLSGQHFDFNVKTYQIEDYLKIIDSKILGGNNSSISGTINIDSNSMHVSGKFPLIGYDNYIFKDINIAEDGDMDSLQTELTAGNIAVSKSINFPYTHLKVKSANDVSEIKLQTSASETLNEAELNAQITTLQDGIKLHFNPSTFIVNEKKWMLDKDGELTLRKRFIDANDIRFHQENQSLVLFSEMDDERDQQKLIINVTNFNLGDFIPFAFKNPEIEGTLTGLLAISDPLGKSVVSFLGKVDSLSIEKQKIGSITLSTQLNLPKEELTFQTQNIDSINVFSADGFFRYRDSADYIKANLIGQKIQLSILEPYLNDLFDQFKGTATASLEISGNLKHQVLTGVVDIDTAALKLEVTQCKYLLKNQKVFFNEDAIELPYLQLKDTLNNTATLNGKISHDFFNSFQFENIKLESGKIALLNTSKVNNSECYGRIIGKATVAINGNDENVVIDITGEPSNFDSSHLYINTSSESKESNKTDYIDFVQYGSYGFKSNSNNNNSVLVNLNIKANPSCKVDVILDEETGDIIRGQGEGSINLKIGNVEPLSIRGTYKLTKGEYNFNFQTFLQKPFTLNSGSITWNGDPYKANIDVYAEYLAKNVDISSLSSTGGFKQKEDIIIISHLTGILQNPNVSFSLLLPERSDAKRDDIIVKRLADFKNDENEMNKQVASLLLFNTFIIGNQNFLTQGNASTLITNTIGGVVSSLLTNMLNKELEKATKGLVSSYIDINPTLDLQKSASQLQANVRAGLKILLSNKVVALVGGNFDYNNPTYAQQLERRGLLTPDINVEWLINKDGSLRVIGFNKSSIDFTLNQRNRSGLQLSYRKDANRFKDLFKKNKKSK